MSLSTLKTIQEEKEKSFSQDDENSKYDSEMSDFKIDAGSMSN